MRVGVAGEIGLKIRIHGQQALVATIRVKKTEDEKELIAPVNHMAGIIFATVLIRIIRAISDATSIVGTHAHESVRYQPPAQASPKSNRASCNENRPPRQLSRASQTHQPTIEACEDQHDE